MSTEQEALEDLEALEAVKLNVRETVREIVAEEIAKIQVKPAQVDFKPIIPPTPITVQPSAVKAPDVFVSAPEVRAVFQAPEQAPPTVNVDISRLAASLDKLTAIAEKLLAVLSTPKERNVVFTHDAHGRLSGFSDKKS